MRQTKRTLAGAVALAVLVLCSGAAEAAGGRPTSRPPRREKPAETDRQGIAESIGRALRGLLGGRSAPQDESDGTRTPKGEGSPGQTLLDALRRRVEAQVQELITREFGAPAPLERESVMLQALDKRGKPIETLIEVEARPLRALNVDAYAPRMRAVMGEDDLTLALYDVLPLAVEPAGEPEGYLRIYAGEDAQALATEAKLIVLMKGGEWREPVGSGAVANAIAVRGLDLDIGLKDNGNMTYDDTMYLIIETPGKETEVHEFRMTTESSSSRKGVGRLNSMQVIYVRGLHRGKDPAYKLKGDAADGTREGMEGAYRILGANVHSAYSRRPIDSTTPLSPNVSLGCQVVAASKRDFERRVVALLDGKGIKEFPYTIIDGEEVELLNDALANRGKHSLLVGGIPRDGSGT